MAIFCAVFAHPDDESFGPGGTLAKLTQTHAVYSICCTDGNHQDKNLKGTRSTELETASKVLGIKRVFQLDFPDGYLSNANYHALADQVKQILDKLQPETVITFHPNGVSGHLDHIAVTSVVNYLFPRLSYLKEIWYYSKLTGDERSDYFVYWPEGVKLVDVAKTVDISATLNIKERAIRSHPSQLPEGDKSVAKLLKDSHEYFLIKRK